MKVAIYGAGCIGQALYKLLQYCPKIENVILVDQHYDQYDGVLPPSFLREANCDVIAIATGNSSFTVEIVNICRDMSVPGRLMNINVEPSSELITLVSRDRYLADTICDEFIRCANKNESTKFNKNLDAIDYSSKCILRNTIYEGSFEFREWFLNQEKQIAYLHNSKVAGSSIEASIYNLEPQSNYLDVHHKLTPLAMRGQLSPEDSKCFKFTYVRNPYKRLVSCYVNKYHSDKALNTESCFKSVNYFMGILDEDQGFEHFVKTVVAIPEYWADRHFRSQYNLIYENGQSLVDYIGKFENLPEDFDKIRHKYQLAPLAYYNVTNASDWMNYYTLETAELVYEKYKRDFDVFGYGDEYGKLVDYIVNRKN